MEHEVRAARDGTVAALCAAVGDVVDEGTVLAVLAASGAAAPWGGNAELPSAAAPSLRADLQELRAREAWLADASRPDAVAKRHALGLRTARENIADLCDAGSFVEYGALAIAAQRGRRELDDLIRNTPADGMVTGIGSINGERFGAERSRAVVLAYDATVLAGTQGMRNHQKTDRLLAIAAAERLPVVLFAEGGGGRPGDVDMPIVAGLHVTTFASFARLSGQVPLVGIAAGRCFAGNAALLGCCDVVIATRASSIGMGGPAMVEGGGLGVFRPEEIGPSDVQSRAGVIDVLVADEAAAVAAARRYLSFLGCLPAGVADDQAALRELLPANRLRVYDIRAVVAALVDRDSLLELRAGFGAGIVTALARIEGPAGRPARQQPGASRRRDRRRRRRQGGALHAALRCARAADRLAHRHAGLHGRPRDREPRPGAPRQPDVRRRRAAARAGRGDRAAQGLRPRRDGDGGGRPARADRDGGLAERRVRRDGARGRGRARLSQGARGRGGRRRARRVAHGSSPSSTRRARRSTWRRRSRSMPSSIRPRAGAGSPRCSKSVRLPEAGGRFIDPW